MAEITLASLHDDIQALRQDMRIDLVRLEAKIDTKPSLMAMFTAVIVVVFGMFGVVASTIAALNSIHLLK